MICQRAQGKACEKSTLTMSGVLKRKYGELEEDTNYSSSSASSPSSSFNSSSGSESDEEYYVSARPLINDFTPTSILKKAKRVKKNKVEFDRVVVFYFPRCQGFTSVPSRGGCTLGMRHRHSYCRQFTLEEFSKEQLNRRRERLKEQLKEEKLMSLRNMLTMNGVLESEKANNLSIDDICDEDIDMTNAEIEDGFCPRMYPAKKRRALLKREGVKIDKTEKRELNEIRKSREDCGCNCQDFCEPETCSCNLAGIKCQRDHSTFPCGCTKDGCGNRNGRVEFNSSRVQTHYIHTVMKLKLEEKQQREISTEPEELCNERIKSFGCPPALEPRNDERTVPLTTPYQFSMNLDTLGENSCSSDTTDTTDVSTSSNQSEEFEELYEPRTPTIDVDDDDLARILRFDESEYDGNSSDCQDNLSIFHPADFFSDNVYQPLPNTDELAISICLSPSTSPSMCMDENANQDSSGFSDDALSLTTSSESIDLSQEEQHSKSDADSVISSDSSSFVFPDYNLGPLYNSLKEYENLDYLSFQLPNLGISQSCDQTTNFLESLISQSETIPDNLVPFTDNQFLEDAFKSSLMETMTA